MNLLSKIQTSLRTVGVVALFNYAGSRIRIAYWKFRGWRLFVTDEESDERWNECFMCPKADLREGVCTACGCPLDAKLPLASEKCPDEKWKRVYAVRK